MHVEDADDGGSGPCHFPRYVISSTIAGAPDTPSTGRMLPLSCFRLASGSTVLFWLGFVRRRAAESAVDASMQSPNGE